MIDAREDWRPTATLEVLRLRAELLARVRSHFAESGALEVETPILVNAAVSDVHLEALEVRRSDGQVAGYLHTSPEYAMKRLLAAGAPDLYQVTHVFREGERGRRHNPEFTMVEWYRLGIDHHALMADVERLLRRLLEPRVVPAPTVYVTYAEAFRRTLGVDPLDCRPDALRAALEARGETVPESLLEDGVDGLLDLAMGTCVAAEFPRDRITFLYDFPASQAALARISGRTAARFEAFWGALELANGFHELGDAAEQERRFAADLEERRRRGRAMRPVDARFIRGLASGLPECAGVALGFDRVVMIASGAESIEQVLAFPVERA